MPPTWTFISLWEEGKTLISHFTLIISHQCTKTNFASLTQDNSNFTSMYVFHFLSLKFICLKCTQNVLYIFRNLQVIVRANAPTLLHCTVQCQRNTPAAPFASPKLSREFFTDVPLISHCISNSNQFQNMSLISRQHLQLIRDYTKSSIDSRRDLAISPS